MKLSSLPPTSAAAQQHINRVYYQVQTWLGKDLQPEQWGWNLQNKILEPITTLLPPAPDELLNTIFCNCKKGCGAKCGCRKVGLQCSPVCGQCQGQACLNASVVLDDAEEICEDEPECALDTETENVNEPEISQENDPELENGRPAEEGEDEEEDEDDESQDEN